MRAKAASRRILYVSSDGVLQPLAYSQVVRVIVGLAKRGYPYDLLSAERPEHLRDTAKVAKLRDRLRAHGVEWHHVSWRSGSTRDALGNLRSLFAAAARRCVTGAVSLLHCRAYHAAAVAWPLHRATGIPYLFDARGYWIDERRDESRWFARPAALRAARAVERRLYLDARAVVTLTRLQQEDLEIGRLGFRCRSPIRTIPTCADYTTFRRDLPETRGPWQSVWARAQSRRVIAVIGSINASYRTDQTLDLARRILERSSDAFLLVLTPQEEEFQGRLDRLGLSGKRVAIRRANHAEMPQWLRGIDWVVSLLHASEAKRASMPTKLAELFAAGVRPIHYGCNTEVSEWVRRAGSGYVLDSLDERELEACADHVAHALRPEGELDVARERTRSHFSLAAGLDRYATLLQELDFEPTLPSGHLIGRGGSSVLEACPLTSA